MAVYNVPEKISMLQQNHLQDLNVSEGGYKLTLAAAFEQCILSCISSYRNEASVWADKIPPFAVCCCPCMSTFQYNCSSYIHVYTQSQRAHCQVIKYCRRRRPGNEVIFLLAASDSIFRANGDFIQQFACRI